MADQRGSSTPASGSGAAGVASAKPAKPAKPSWSRPKPEGPARPPFFRTMFRGFTKRCANCGSGHLFDSWFRMKERCPRCGLKFHRQEGQWSGDIGANTIVTFGLLWVVLVIGSLLTWNDPNLPLLAVLAAVIVIAFPPFFVPFAKTLWVAVDVLMRPVEPNELRPAATGDDPAAAPVPGSDLGTAGA